MSLCPNFALLDKFTFRLRRTNIIHWPPVRKAPKTAFWFSVLTYAERRAAWRGSGSGRSML